MKFTKVFKCLVVAAVMISAATVPVRAAEKGDKVFGVRTGYVSRNNSADIGLFFQYTFNKYFRLQPSADLVFRHNDRDAFMVDINGQVPIDFSTDKFNLYPFAGLNFSSWNHHLPATLIPSLTENGAPGVIPASSSRSNYFGVNFGAGFDLNVSKTLRISLEAGYTFVKSNSGVRVLAGIGYIF